MKTKVLILIVATASIFSIAATTLVNLATQVSGVLPVANGGTGSTSGDLPSGMIAFINTGTCPTGWTEQSYTGKYPLMTIAANGDVGATGGSTSYTPAGTNGTTTTAATSAGTPAGTNGTSAVTTVGTKMTTSSSGTYAFTTLAGTASAASPTVTVPAQVFTGTAMATHAHTVPAEAFTGTGATIQPPYIKLIPCQKN